MPDAPVLPVAYRSAVLIDAPDEPQKVKVYRGTVVWKLDRLTPAGKPPSVAVRADIDVPDVKLRASIVIQKNVDATLPASHTMEIRFLPGTDSEVGGVKAIKVPEMRREELPSGDALAGAPAPVIENFFFVGLSRSGDNDVSRNIELLTSRGWIDVPMLLSNDKIAKLTVEKGVTGDQVLTQALEAWK